MTAERKGQKKEEWEEEFKKEVKYKNLERTKVQRKNNLKEF